MPIDDIDTVCFVGAGTMGCYNSIIAAVSGYEVVLYDVQQSTLAQVEQKHRELATQLVAHGYCNEAAIPEALARVSVVDELAHAVHNADLVSESVFERIDLKRATHRELDQICREHTLLTTNSSALLVSDIEDVVARGDKFAALHSHLGSPLVDIVGGRCTHEHTIDVLQRYVVSIGGVPLRLRKEYPGYVLNAMLGPVLAGAMQLLTAELATVEEIDRSWMIAQQAAVGPFGLIDLFGLNVVLDSWQYRPATADNAALRSSIIELLGAKLQRNELGVKSGRGFYQYPDASYQRTGFLQDGPAITAATDTLLTALIGNALIIAANEVLDPVDIDRAWMVGMFQQAGPFSALRALGFTTFSNILGNQMAGGFFNAQRGEVALAYLREFEAKDSTCT